MKKFALTMMVACAAAPLYAGSFGVYSSVQGGGQGCSANYSYDTTDGGSGGQSTSPNQSDFNSCVNSFSGSVNPGLTSSSAQANESMVFGFNTPMTANQSTSVDLSTASLHAFADATLDSNGNGGITGSFAQSEFWDTLAFSIPGATDSTVTQIGVTFSVDGSASDGNCQNSGGGPCMSRSADLEFGDGGVGCFDGGNVPDFCQNAGTANWAWSEGSFVGGFGDSSLVTWNNASEDTNTDLVLTGTLNLVGADPTIGLWAGISLDALPPGTLDFSNTASISFQVPNSVTYTSGSGVFDSAETPEPSTLFLAGTGLILVLFGTWARRRPGSSIPA